MGRFIDIDSLKGCAIIRPTSHETIEHIKKCGDDCLNHDDIPTVYNNGWIPVEIAMPEEHDSIFAKYKGTDVWDEAMFEKLSDDVSVTIEFSTGQRKTKVLYTKDGTWTDGVNANYKVIAWQPLPAPYQKGRVAWQ